MQITRPLSTFVHALIGVAACLDAAALGFASAPQHAVLGQPLDFAVELRLEPGETLDNECVSAEVLVGDQRLPPALVRARLESRGPEAALLRVTTTPSIDEPVVAVSVAAGCASKVSRRFVLLADPPPAQASAPLLMAVADTGATAMAGTLSPPPNNLATTMVAIPVAATNAAAPPAPQRAKARPVAERSTRRPTAARADGNARPARKQPAAAPVALAAAAGPRLQLDPAETAPADALSPADVVVEEAIAAVAAAASAARTAAAAASASAQRIATLEDTVQALRAQVQASQQETALWRAKGGEGNRAPAWLMPLLLALVALLGLVGWLLWRLQALQQEQQRSWLRAAAAAAAEGVPSRATAPIPLVTSELNFPPSIPAPLVPARPAWPAPMAVPVLQPGPASAAAADARAEVDLPLEPAHQRTEVLPPSATSEHGAPRDVSIDELLDLEQQADFFVVLGQDDAAVELLVDHLRVTGGGSPLPYLKLLEIYRRLNDRDAYERTRSRFNDRFNAYASEWDHDLQSGRALDDYPGVLPRLQQVWPRPLDAMAELEALLFRKSRGDLFDLPAYREVLFLYSLARDLLEREPPEAGQVDLLLPLADGSEFGTTSPAPFLSLGSDDHDERDGRPTAPLDLDLDLGQPTVPRAGLFNKPGAR